MGNLLQALFSIVCFMMMMVMETLAAKGGLRAGVLSRNSLRRSKNRGYDSGWDGHQMGYGSYRRRNGQMTECNEVCQYNRLMGLENDSSEEKEKKKPEISSVAPCVGLCHVERVQEMEKDNQLKTLKKQQKKCVGLCFLLRRQGLKMDPNLESLQRRRPCV